MPPALTIEMMLVIGVLALAIVLFAFEVVRVDVAAFCLMVLVGLLGTLPGVEPLLPMDELFSGFSSNAVISVISVMIIGAGLDKTGLMSRIAQVILARGGRTETRVTALVTGSVAFVSSFMQNVAAAALFMPVVSRIASRTGIPISRLLMPMGFCAILGGTCTLIGSSPLILLGDLMISANRTLPSDRQMEPFGLFSVLPIGLALVATGIAYFVLAGRFVLPSTSGDAMKSSRPGDYFERVYGIKGELFEARVTDDSPQVGLTLQQVEDFGNKVRPAGGPGGDRTAEGGGPTGASPPTVLALYSGDVVKVPPDRDEMIWVGTQLGLMGDREQIERWCSENRWQLKDEPDRFADVLNAQHGGVAEIVVPPGSSLIGQSIGEIKPRRSFGTNILQIYRTEQVIVRNFRDEQLHAGDTLVVHASWKDLHKLSRTRRQDLVLATDVRYEDLRTHKVRHALGWFALAIALFPLTGSLPVSLLTGAVGMVLSGVLTMDEAYTAVSWQTVFLLASLIPVGIAVDRTGTATWIADEMLLMIGDVPIWALQGVIAGLATFFTLVMSNIGATVLLVPFAVSIANSVGADPAVFALTVAISTSNSFLIPTHQVNALLMGPGGYQVSDFMRAGGIMTVLYLVVSLTMIDLVF